MTRKAWFPLAGQRRLTPLCAGLMAAGQLLMAAGPQAASASALTDGTVGPVQSFSGRFTVPASVGTTKGSNLFHSFANFGVLTGESATFATSNAALRNVIVRVTGGQPSSINGSVRLTAAAGTTPNLWFMNPSGIVVGPRGSFNVPGSLSLSTAQWLDFADGTRWNATATPGGTLSVAAPGAFGFLPDAPVGALNWSGGTALLSQKGSLSLYGRDVSVGNRSQLAAAQIHVEGTRTVSIEGASIETASDAATGAAPSLRVLGADVNIANSSLIHYGEAGTAEAAGGLRIRGTNSVQVGAGSVIAVVSTSANAVGGLAIDAGELLLIGGGTSVQTATRASGAGPALRLGSAKTLSVTEASYVASDTDSPGKAGDVTLTGRDISLSGGSVVQSSAEALSGAPGAVTVAAEQTLGILASGVKSLNAGQGVAGAMRLSAQHLTVDGQGQEAGAQVLSLAQAGTAAPITLLGTESVQLRGNANVFQHVETGARAAPVAITGGDIDLTSGGILALTTTDSRSAPVSVEATRSLVIRDGFQIGSDSNSAGGTGTVSLSARLIEISGTKDATAIVGNNGDKATIGTLGDVLIHAGELNLRGEVGVSTISSSASRPGAIQITADRVTIDGKGSSAAVFSWGQGSSQAGPIGLKVSGPLNLLAGGAVYGFGQPDAPPSTITVEANSVLLDNQGLPNAFTGLLGNSYRTEGVQVVGANIQVNAPSVVLKGGASITTSTNSERSAGSIAITADSIRVEDNNDFGHLPTRIEALTSGSGNGGNVVLRSKKIDVVGGAQISVNSEGPGTGGNIDIQTDQLTVTGTLSSISASSKRGGDGGSITIKAADMALDASGRVESAALNSGSAGEVTIQAQRLVMGNRAAIAAGTLSSGDGGSITVFADTVVMNSGARMYTTTLAGGNAGDIFVRAKDRLTMAGGAYIEASTQGSGIASNVQIEGGSVDMSGVGANGARTMISSEAGPDSSGHSAVITVRVQGDVRLSDGALITTTNASTASPDLSQDPSGVDVFAKSLTLANGAQIRADAEGSFGAGGIRVETSGPLALSGNSAMSTTSLNGNGGPILLSAGGAMRLRDSQITTSVRGKTNGNGGAIEIEAPALLMQSGFIQANTAAPKAVGGNVKINTGLLLPDGSNLRTGGATPETFKPGVAGLNVIQAAAPDGVSGQLNVGLPTLNVAAALAALNAPRFGAGVLAVDWCETPTDSSMTVLTRGALYPWASGPLSPAPRSPVGPAR